ncbi:MAG TPA: hypothetical protein VH327_03315 [Gammaproteobacteria bacterium]|jgi:hypothetical protein|nr:hypothetical protein [Gammaproteobacteria bacterium]
MNAADYSCWKCGVLLEGVPVPLSRLSVCLKCGSELYACLMCRFHDPKLTDGCREERAEHVQIKDRANFCEYLEPRAGAHLPKDGTPGTQVHAELDALFGGPKPEAAPDAARSELDKLFGNKTKA